MRWLRFRLRALLIVVAVAAAVAWLARPYPFAIEEGGSRAWSTWSKPTAIGSTGTPNAYAISDLLCDVSDMNPAESAAYV